MKSSMRNSIEHEEQHGECSKTEGILLLPFLTMMLAWVPGPNLSLLQLATALPRPSTSLREPSSSSVGDTVKWSSPARSTTLMGHTDIQPDCVSFSTHL